MTRSHVAGHGPGESHQALECMFCEEPVVPEVDPVCARCRELVTALDWRVVYDRDRGIGAIPPNLVAVCPRDGIEVRLVPARLSAARLADDAAARIERDEAVAAIGD